MNTQELSSKLFEAVENYYTYNPDTLMPMLMAALASNGKLKVGATRTEGTEVLCDLELNEILNYEWVRLNPRLCRKVKTALKEGSQVWCIEGFIDEELKDIYEIFHLYDNFTVKEEYHHRIGILNQHSRNHPSDWAHRNYATICMAEAMVALPVEYFRKSFYTIANHMLQKSGLQPARPRMEVACALTSLLEYDGKGKVYNPFAGCGIAAAMMGAGADMYADGNHNDKLFAVARLLNYGVSGSYENYRQRDSRQWIEGSFDYVLSTYRGYIDGQSAFDFCLSKCFETLNEGGKFAGIVSPKDIFEKQSDVFKEALRRDWVETIILLPFAEVAVLINTRKPKEHKSNVLFYNFAHPMYCNNTVTDNFATVSPEIVRVSDVRKKGYLRGLVVQEVIPREGCELVNLRDYVKKVKRQTYSLARVPEDERILARIDRTQPYDKLDHTWMQGIEKGSVTSLFTPVYHLNNHALIVNDRGTLEPRLFNPDHGAAFFGGGFAFEIIEPYETDYEWLLGELNSLYVNRQLHPYGMDKMLPEFITEDQILDLKLNKPVSEEENDASLEPGYMIKSGSIEYTIQKFIDHGSDGYAYIALQNNKATGQQVKVVLKEFYPYRLCDRDGARIVLTRQCDADTVADYRRKFIEEAEIMKKLGNVKGSHIVPASSAFYCEETDTMYYAMPFFDNGSLYDLIVAGYIFKEDMVINRIVKPLCKALHVAHSVKVLHLDVKPENILLDQNGEVVLIDFGVAKQYDSDGNVINSDTYTLSGIYSAPELRYGNTVKFGRPVDIYSLAATIYHLLVAPEQPYPVYEYSNQDERLRIFLEVVAGCSKQFSDAIVAGLQFSASARPADAQAFLNMFPGCENIKL